MEEKILNEEQAAEQTTSQETENVNELDTLKAKLAEAEKSLDFNRKMYVEYMNQRDILKKTLEELCKRKNISKAEMYEAMVTSNDMELDEVLAKLGRTF